MPARLIRMSGQPGSVRDLSHDFGDCFGVTDIDFVELDGNAGDGVEFCGASSPRSCFKSSRAMVDAPASASA